MLSSLRPEGWSYWPPVKAANLPSCHTLGEDPSYEYDQRYQVRHEDLGALYPKQKPPVDPAQNFLNSVTLTEIRSLKPKPAKFYGLFTRRNPPPSNPVEFNVSTHSRLTSWS